MNFATAVVSPRSIAYLEFSRAYAGQWWRELWRMMRRQNGRLLNLRQMKKDMNVASSHYLGIRLVPISQIVGSEGRSHEFTADFRPTKSYTSDRWVNVVLAHWRGVPLPPVELLLINKQYFVRDGHHRISVARHLGQIQVEAEVTEWVLDTAVALETPKPEIDWQLLDRMRLQIH
jgi:hypothetical protein